MAYIQREEAKNVLAPHFPLLRSCIHDAWAQSLTVPFRHHFKSRTKSCIVHDLIIAQVKERFVSIEGVSLAQTKHYLFLKVGNYLIRFKKLDINRLPMNYSTQQAVALECQELTLPGMEDHILLNAGYRTDTLGIKIAAVFLTCQRGKINEWEIMLEGGSELGYIPVPTQQTFDDDNLIRVKQGLIRKEETGEPLQSKS